MNPKSMEVIYKALNAIASRRLDADTEQQLAHAIDQELLAVDAYAVVESRSAIGLNAEAM